MTCRPVAPGALGALLLLTAGVAPARELAPEPGYLVPSLVRLRAAGPMRELIDEARSRDWDVVSRGEGWIEVLMPRDEALGLARVQRVARAFGRRPGEDGRALRADGALASLEVLAEDVDSQLDPFIGREDAGDYHTYAEVKDEIDAHLSARPDLLRVESIGTSVEGREILAVEITGPGDASDRPATLITGLHHAREWISVEVPMAVIDLLVSGHGEDPWVTEMLATRRVWVVPVVNPDGHHYSVTRRRMWRKNRQPVGWGATGVDPNRNYGYQWGGQGSSGMPWSQTYRGPEAFSEPETRAIRDLAERIGFESSLSFHSYSQLVLWPWGHTDEPSPQEEVLRRHGQAMAELTGYRGMQSSGLYVTTGDFSDWFHGAHGALSYTFELGRQFVPPEDEIPGIVAKNLQAVRYFLEHTL